MAQIGSAYTRWWLSSLKAGDVIYVQNIETKEVSPATVKKVNEVFVTLEDRSQIKLDGFGHRKQDSHLYAMHPIEVEQSAAEAAVTKLKSFDWESLSKETLADLFLRLELLA